MRKQIYIYDARYNYKKPTTYDMLVGITGSSKHDLYTVKTKKEKIIRLKDCYIIDDNTPKSQLREWHSKVKFKGELWAKINDKYSISNYGRVKSYYHKNKYPKGKILLPSVEKMYSKKRFFITLYIDGTPKTCFIHRLVAKYFVKNPKNLPCVIHKNGLYYDNYYLNLKYCTRLEASSHGASIKKIRNQRGIVVLNALTGEYINTYATQKDAALDLGVHRNTISNILRGKVKESMLIYKFIYEDKYDGEIM